MRVADVGCGDKKTCQQFYPKAQIVTFDAHADTQPDVVHDMTTPFPNEHQAQYDAVFCSHVMEHIDRMKVIETMKNMVGLLRPGGDLVVIVPALEWAAREIMAPRQSPALISFLFGSQDTPWQYHRSGYTLGMLRSLFRIAGLTVIEATQGTFAIHMEHGDLTALQNIVVGRKIGAPADALG